MFLDGGIGLLRFDGAFPSVGTRTNFEQQVGVGFTVRVQGDVHLLTGLRYLHASNADQFGARRNPGFDAVTPYVGLTWRF